MSASVENSWKPASAYRLARAGEYAGDLRLRRPPTRATKFYVGDVWGYTQHSRRDMFDVDMEEGRWFAYQPIRDDATLRAFIDRHRRDRSDIKLLTPWLGAVASPDVCAVGVGDSGGPVAGVIILTRWVTVEPADKRGLKVTYDIYVDALYVAPKARGNFYGWSLMAYAAHQAFLDLDHLAVQMRRDSQQATLQARVGAQPLHWAAQRMIENLHWQLDQVYRDRDQIRPNLAYRGYTGCEDCID